MKPPIPEALDPWDRIAIDTTEGEPFHTVLRIANFAASDWIFSPRGPYANPGMTGADRTHGAVREALLHLLELGFIDIDTERLKAMRFVPTGRPEPGA